MTSQHLDGSGTVKRAKGTHPSVGACQLRLVEYSAAKDAWGVVLGYTDAKGFWETRKAGGGTHAQAEAAFDKLVGQMADVTMEG